MKKEFSSEIALIDGSSFIYRAFYAIPGFLANSKGLPTKAIFGVTQMLLKILKEWNPRWIVWFMDEAAPTFRHELYADYKATRPKMPDELKIQIPYIKEVVKALGIPIVSASGYEADDLIASFVKRVLPKTDKSVTIIAGDRDLYPLISERIKLYDPVREKVFGREEFLKKYEFEPEFFPHFRALTGDKSDNIPGVPGIGEKTAKRLISQFKTLERIYENLSKVTPKRVRDSLATHKELAFKSLELVTLNFEAPLPSEELEYYEKKPPHLDELKRLFRELEFRKFLKDFEFGKEKLDLSTLEELPDFSSSEYWSLYLVQKREGLFESTKTLCYLCGGEKRVYQLELDALKRHLDSTKWFLFDYKEFLKKTGISLGKVVDVKLGAYLLNPSVKNPDLYTLLKQEGDLIIENSPEQLSYGLWNFGIQTLKRLEEEKVLDWLNKVEVPLSEVLFYMEKTGFKVDVEYLRSLAKEYLERIKQKEEEIFDACGRRFNLRSSREVANILFNVLELPKIKPTPKEGVPSTDAEVLETLAGLHPVPKLLLEYRSLYKVKSTYIEPLLRLASSKDHRVHTEFLQTGTATGRLASKNPNLQNIPVRGEEGAAIRRAFIAEEGFVLCSMDYSQIELRLLAHFSGDESLIKAFERGEDIHTFTACEVFGVPPELVTPEMRRMSKAINFGIAYGMSAYGLAKELKIEVKDADAIIKSYFERYPGIKRYIEEVHEFVKTHGYVKTISGRKRFVPEVFSSNRGIRELGFRIAVNTPIQGSAADLIKCAMVSLFKELQKQGLKTRLILQVHDELILEIPEEEVDQVEKIALEIMEKPFESLGIPIHLNVPLKVNVSYGKNWAECKN